MTSAQWIGVTGIGLILALGWLAFRQSMKVKPEKDKDPFFGGLPPGSPSGGS